MQETSNFCGACGDVLTERNWYPSLKKQKTYRCSDCYQEKFPKAYCPQCGLKLQEGRCFQCHLMKEDRCAKCGVLLTDANWQQTFRKRKVRRCISCHVAVCADWDARNPGHAAKRQRTYKAKYPEKQPSYYREHREEYAQRAINRLWKVKVEAITKMGGKCVACGMTDMRVLQINHINGQPLTKERAGFDMYKGIILETRATDDLDVRCANCNVIYEYERGNRRTPIWFALDEATPDDDVMIEDLIKEEE